MAGLQRLHGVLALYARARPQPLGRRVAAIFATRLVPLIVLIGMACAAPRDASAQAGQAGQTGTLGPTGPTGQTSPFGQTSPLGPTGQVTQAAQPGATEPFSVRTGLRGEATYTTNAGFDTGGADEPDLIVEAAPYIALRGGGARLQTYGTLELRAIGYANGTQANRILPNGQLGLTLEAVENWFFVDTSVNATQDLIDPFGVRPAGASTVNTQTAVQYRLVPYIQGQFSPTIRYLVRSDNTYTRTYPQDLAFTANDGYFGRHIAEIEQQPRPLGWRLAYERADRQLSAELAPRETLQIVRASLRYQLTYQFAVGARYGTETNNFTFLEYQDNTVVGGEIEWRPTDRTLLRGFVEDRFFGTGWNVDFSHRMPWLAWNLSSGRGLSTGQQVLLTVPAGASVAALLNDMLTTRVPDPAQRDALVQDLVQRGRLPATFSRDTNIYAEQVSLVTATRGTVALLGVRNSFALSGFRTRTEDLSTLGFAPILGTPTDRTNNLQTGLNATYSLAVTPSDAIALTEGWTKTVGLADFSDEQTRQTATTLVWTRQTNPRRSVRFGLRRQKIDSNVVVDATESAVFAGFNQRF